MKSITKYLVVAFALLSAVSFSSSAFATCTMTGKVYRTYANSTGATDFGYYYLAPLSGGVPLNYVYYFYTATDDDRLGDTLAAALASNHTVTVNANAATCPTAGSYRYGGAANYGFVYTGR